MTTAAAISALTRLSDGVRLDQRHAAPRLGVPHEFIAAKRTAAGDRPVLVQPHCGCQTDDVNAQPNPTPSYALAPLRWVAEEDLLYDPRSRTLHRSSCHVAREHVPVRSVPAGSAVEPVWVPRMC